MAMAAQDIPQPMQPPRMVNDFSSLLSTDEQNQLEQVLQAFYYETSSQIYIVILDDLQGYDIAEYSQMLGEKWGVGTQGKDNGIVILVNPSPDRQHGKAFIATGYGLEGAVPDALANRIVDLDMVPCFKQQQYFNGLMAASKSIMELARGEYTADEYLRSRAASQGSNIPLVPVIIFFVILFSILGRSRTNRSSSLGRSLPFWAAMFMLGSNKHSSHSGKFGNFSSGSGSFGSFGGFGGGGGGHFGGGGAGGSW
jgi:uncharacterized protein